MDQSELRKDQIIAEGFIGDQKWAEAQDDNGVRWAVPVGWPNNSSPVCEEDEPDAYREIISAISK